MKKELTLIEKLESVKQQALRGDLQDVDLVTDEFDNCIKEAQKLLSKAQKWDELDEKISKFYLGQTDVTGDHVYDENEFEEDENEFGEDGEEGSLLEIGEIAAIAFGYL